MTPAPLLGNRRRYWTGVTGKVVNSPGCIPSSRAITATFAPSGWISSVPWKSSRLAAGKSSSINCAMRPRAEIMSVAVPFSTACPWLSRSVRFTMLSRLPVSRMATPVLMPPCDRTDTMAAPSGRLSPTAAIPISGMLKEFPRLPDRYLAFPNVTVRAAKLLVLGLEVITQRCCGPAGVEEANSWRIDDMVLHADDIKKARPRLSSTDKSLFP